MASTDKKLVQQMLAAAAVACDERKAEDIRILSLDPSESGLTDYFLICSGNSDRQNVAITDAIEIKLKHEFATYPNSVEGRRQGEWILMDYVDFIVHVFSAEKRAFYGLERLRKTATVLSIDELNNEIKAAITTTRSKTPAAPKPAAKKAIAGKKTLPAKKSPAKKSPAKKTLSTRAAAKSAATKLPPTSTPAKKTPAKKAAPKKSPAKASTKKASTKKA